MVEKKNPDYTESAINLNNPPEVKELLEELLAVQTYLAELRDRADACVPKEIKDETEEATLTISKVRADLIEAIEEHGSYQDVEAGRYAVQQLKKSSVYHVEPFKEHYEKYAGAVIEETINKKAIEGLIKGKLIEKGDLEVFKVLTYDETRAFIIK